RRSPSALALCTSRTVGSGEEPLRNHRVVLWSSVISVEVDHLIVGGDTLAVGEEREDAVGALE
ncbi:MAG: hypothetical protein Q8N23_24820, partial [Archangium sp.]|nr:hypothetical protein [Archangium sp.]